MQTEIGEILVSPSSVDVIVEWKIDNFKCLPTIKGISYISPDFSVGGERWCLQMYPYVFYQSSSCGGYVDLYLCKQSSNSSIRQAFSFSLKTEERKKELEKHSTKLFKGGAENIHGFCPFISRSELLSYSNKFMLNSYLTVICTMKNTTSARSATCVEACTQTAEDRSCVEACTQTAEERCNSDSVEYCTFDSDSAEHSSDSAEYYSDCGECCHKCSDCLDIVKKQKLLEEMESQKERSEAYVEASTQTAEERSCLEACIQTVEERYSLKFIYVIKVHCNIFSIEDGVYRIYRAAQMYEDSVQSVSAGKDPECAYVEACTQTLEEEFTFNNVREDCGFVTDINHLLKENRSIDVTFELETPSGKTKLFAHKLILAVMSSYFADEFYDKERNDGHQVIPLKGVSPKAFEQMIRYCYGEKPSLRTSDDACGLFKVASEFKVIGLQNLCQTFFRHIKIEPGNVFSILKISVEMEVKCLQDMCYQILQEKTREVMAAYELCDITPAMVYTLLKMPKLSLNSEYELISWIFDWAKVKPEDKTRDYLVQLLRNMNFLALTVKEFVMLTRDNPKFFNSDEIASVSMNIVIPGTREMPVWHNKDLKGRIYTRLNE